MTTASKPRSKKAKERVDQSWYNEPVSPSRHDGNRTSDAKLELRIIKPSENGEGYACRDFRR